ncbi:Protein rds1 [Sphaceloma murrayae]|uniref:Protein rds1 n=1 Tax=Sphaceloma murrayae TaxID=2082308 RepID=A0A2K1R0G3_9PEZI|nr:Protein rds1 [Sphaceloma murrayae]
MIPTIAIWAAAAVGCANALPAPQVSGYSNADAPYVSDPIPSLTDVATSFGPNSQINAIETTAPANPGASRVSNDPTGVTYHGPYTGIPTTLGAESTIALAQTIPNLGPAETATYYNTNGKLQQPEPVPYQPAGGLGTNGTLPRYQVNSDFDYQSIALALHQEWIELDCFNNGLATFSDEDFLAVGLTPETTNIIRFMAQQETGHATLLTNLLGETAPKQCTYNYPYSTVRQFIEFNQILTRFGESGVLGFAHHLDSREVGTLLSQSIHTEARQQMIFRQLLGQSPMPVWFEAGIPQSWAWSFLAPYISSCPENNTRLAWQNFPALNVANQANPNRWSANDTANFERVGNRTSDPASEIPQDASCANLNVTGYGCGPAITRNRSEPLSFPGKQVNLTWDLPGQAVGPNNSYFTDVSPISKDANPSWVLWVSQLNATYSELHVTGDNQGYTYQPAGDVYEGEGAINDTMFIAITSEDIFVTPFNLSNVNPYVKALGIYIAG